MTQKKTNTTPETKIVCPVCGTRFALPEHESYVVGVAIGQDSGLGTIYPAVAGASTPIEPTPTHKRQTPAQMKAEAKIEALRKAGVNVDNFFSMKGATGQEIIARLENGNLNIVPDDDPIFAAIMRNGTVPNRRLFRRWVMAQMFHMLTYRSWNGFTKGFTPALDRKGYKYQWKMVVEEMRVQAKLAVADPENFILRNRWFNAPRIVEMAEDYMAALGKRVRNLRVRHCKGAPYVRLGGCNIFTSDLQRKIFGPLAAHIELIRRAKTPGQVYNTVCNFSMFIKRYGIDDHFPMSQAFKDAYKGSGAYFTMKNLILFHGASFKNGCVKMNQRKSLSYLEEKAIEYAASNEGWRLFGVMKKLIDDAGINIEQKMAEWRK